jgi:pyruvate-ferredoxin/flavodoxin oxidoreductase
MTATTRAPAPAITVDGNEACASVAYRINEVCSIYPITPSSSMAELADQWSSEGRPNIWGSVPQVVEMQSEGGAAGALHGALQAGALGTTFTASQGLLLMIPNMYKIAGELTSTVFHVAARSIAAHALSIFGDHQDVMAVRPTGFALLASGSVQEAQDLALIAQMATLEARVPFLHFFDGFRTSHELSRIVGLTDDDLRALIDDDLVRAHRARALDPDHPFIRGTAQNPDVYFQSREAANPFFARTPAILDGAMRRFAARTGREYRLFEYCGAPDAERVVITMGSSSGTVQETVARLVARGDRVGVLQVRLFRPFSAAHLLAALPETTRAVAVLDRTKESGAQAEPLCLDVVAALAEAGRRVSVIGGRYGLSSKEFTPAMAKAVLDELDRDPPRNHFVVGIDDDVGHTSLAYDPAFRTEPDAAPPFRAVFYGLGSDGTVGANKNTCKILGEEASLFVQGYFVYDSKKSGSRTVSHLRFGREPIRSAYLIDRAQFVACHHFAFLRSFDVLGIAAEGATFLLNSPYGAGESWERLPRPVQEEIIRKGLAFWVIDATAVAREAGIKGRINTVLQTCFFVISGVLPRDHALEKIKATIRKTYDAKGEEVVRRNLDAVDATIARLAQVPVPARATSRIDLLPVVSSQAPAFVREVTAPMLAGRGNTLPVSALPVDGTYPSATSRWEKRNIAELVAEWDPGTCIQCGNCAMVCPHAVIRAGLVDEARLAGAPAGFMSAPIDERGFPTTRYTLQVYVEDCTGCGLCVEVCPAQPDAAGGGDRRAINLTEREPVLERARASLAFFESLPVTERAQVDFSTVRGTQFLEPMFEFSGACAGCGETPYLGLLSRLFGDRMLVANATGCSSIYGGNLPTTPWATNAEGRGPAWSNSLFEDNAEFGLGMRLAADGQLAMARRLTETLGAALGSDLAQALITAPQRVEREIRAQRLRVAAARERLLPLADAGHEDARQLLSVIGSLVRRSVWIVGGDGWAYDIGSGGLDHVLASGRDVNVLVLDTEVYSNTGGQASKATPLAAVAKFAHAGKATEKKDLALQAIAYGNVYVARVALGANPQQTLLALREAEAYQGPSLVLAYSHCIEHGYDLRLGLDQQRRAVHSGYWPLVRYNPALRHVRENPFTLDSPRPTTTFRDYAERELRYRELVRSKPAEAEALLSRAEDAVARRWKLYEGLAQLT